MSDVTRVLRGKRVAEVLTNGRVLQIRCHDGTEVSIAWVDDNGAPINGKPTAALYGHRLLARGMQDLIRLPNQLFGERHVQGR